MIGLELTPVKRPIFVDSLPGGVVQLESIWSFLSTVIDICLQDLVVTFATGELIYLTPFERAEKVLVGLILSIPAFQTFYESIEHLEAMTHLTGHLIPGVSPCSFMSMSDILGDPPASYVLRVITQYVS